jgi:hypothetical protein
MARDHNNVAMTQVPLSIGDDQKNQAMAILFMSVKDDIICYIFGQDDPSQCWTMLQNLFENQKHNKDIIFVKQDAYNVHGRRTSFLKVVRDVVDENTIVHIILNALPATYEGFM